MNKNTNNPGVGDASQASPSGMLGPAQIRQIASALGIRPTKTLGQNFVHDAGTVRMIVRESAVGSGDSVLEVGPGLGSLTLALLEAGAYVSAVEIDSALARALPRTVEAHQRENASRLAVLHHDALRIRSYEDVPVPEAWAGAVSEAGGSAQPFEPKYLVANLPYNVAVPVLMTVLDALPSVQHVTVMVQAEVADRLAAAPASRIYGVPSVKAAWYGSVRRGVTVSRNVFWPVPNVDSALVHLDRWPEPRGTQAQREKVFALVDAAFAQRRKTLRAALASWAGTAALAEQILRAAGVDPSLRGERLGVEEFMAIAKAQEALLLSSSKSAKRVEKAH